MLARAGLPSDTPADYISPCSRKPSVTPRARGRRRRARYAAWCCAFLFLGDEEGIRLDPLECFPLDPIAVLAAALCPVLPAEILETVQVVCNRRIVAASEDEAVRLRSDHNVRWFVGLACVGDGFSGCIVGWMPIQSSDDVLYKVLTTSGSELYVREEEVNPLIVLPQVGQRERKDVAQRRAPVDVPRGHSCWDNLVPSWTLKWPTVATSQSRVPCIFCEFS
ncbi:hypothetical protein A0H81_01218 [Grifola frondosa]|uniref:Uncharacterized protein n=1 Tax=Grifola frondosa TaxID=5627 RepID=A0A1C7MPE1_GRIFR|nr:hypothetical protein A0H81_01218 [Grifola frondosa]